MICDPWGQILVRAQDTPGVFSARIDPDRLRQVRSWIPMEAHRLDLDVLPVATAKASPKRELSVATQDKS
jgi:nitrilase